MKKPEAFLNQCPFINEDFCSRSRHAKKITTGICVIFRGLFFEHNTEIGQKGHLWMDTNWFFIIFIWSLLSLSALLFRPLMPVDETRYVSVAWEMWVKGNFLVPHINGIPYSHKPPLLFWLIHIGWWLFGVNEWTARLTVPFFGLCNLFIAGHLTSRLWPKDSYSARLVPFILLGMPIWIVFGTITMFDMVLTFFVLLAALGILTSGLDQKPSGWLLFSLSIGGGILTKGPVMLVHVLPFALLAPWWTQKDLNISWLKWYTKVLASLTGGIAVALAWALPAAQAGGPVYAKDILWGQTAGRVIASFAHGRPVWWYILFLPVILFPWFFWFPLLKGTLKIKLDSGIRFCLSWIVSSIIILSLVSGKQIHYLLPILPAFALLIAKIIKSIKNKPLLLKSRSPLIAFFFILGIALFLLPFEATRHADIAPFQAMQKVWGFVPLLIGLWFMFRRFENVESFIKILCLSVVVLVVVLQAGPVNIIAPAYDVSKMAKKISAVQNNGKNVAIYPVKYFDQFQFSGRLIKPLYLLKDNKAINNWINLHKDDYILVFRRNNNLQLYGTETEFRQRFRDGWLSIWKSGNFKKKIDRADSPKQYEFGKIS